MEWNERNESIYNDLMKELKVIHDDTDNSTGDNSLGDTTQN